MLSTNNAREVLDALPKLSQDTLIQRWMEQPDSFQVRTDEHCPEVRKIVATWCQERVS
jgi:hypothetical protein